MVRSHEPESVEPQQDQIPADNSSVSTTSEEDQEEMDPTYAHCPQARLMVQRKDYISLLKLGWNKKYNEDPSFNTKYDPRDGVGELEEELMAGPWGTIVGKARNKKLAQHRAAEKLLLAIVDSGRHKEFYIPGHDADEARHILTVTMSQEEPNSKTNNNNTVIAQCQTTGNALSSGNSTDSGSGALLNTNVSQGPLASNNVAPIQINWVGRVGELVQKKRIMSEWKDVYTQTGQANAAEHTCQLLFDILDAVSKKPIRHLEGVGRARNKKQAKQLAFKQIYDQLHEQYCDGSAVTNSATGASSAGLLQTVTATTQKEISFATNIAEQNAHTVSNQAYDENGLMEVDEAGDNENDEMTERPDIRLLLSQILSDRQRNTDGAEQYLRQILRYKDSQVERVFRQAQLKFIESSKSSYYNIVQIYLEIWITTSTSANNKKLGPKTILLCTFGGEGANMEQARDDACWQAMEFLYIFGGFAPSSADKISNDDEPKETQSFPIAVAAESEMK